MYNEVSSWIDNALSQEVSSDVVAFCFNLYEDGDNQWSMEMIGAESFDLSDEDWPCREVTEFGTREEPFAWVQHAEWNKILDDVVSILKEYLEHGKFADKLKSKAGLGVGFVDGSIEILYYK